MALILHVVTVSYRAVLDRVALQIINQPLDIPLLSLATGYSVDEILTALLTLREMGVVMEHPGGRWTERLVFTDPDFLHPPNLISIN